MGWDDVDRYVLSRYDLIECLGRGAYGIVWKAVDKSKQEEVALKKICGAFQSPTDAQRTFREIAFLQELAGHDNVIYLTNVVRAANDLDIYLVTDCMEADLRPVINANILAEVHKRWIVYQVLRALGHLHARRIMHRDMKPSNIILNKDCSVKLCDFGLARSVDAHEATAFTDYVATRWYRAPEIVLGVSRYTVGVDIWGAGCIFGELLLGTPVFPGLSTMEQLCLILAVTGYPEAHEIDALDSRFAASMLDGLPRGPPALLQVGSPDAADVLRGCLTFMASRRVTALRALQYPYFSDCFEDDDGEPVALEPVVLPLDDSTTLPSHVYRDRIYRQMLRNRRELCCFPDVPVVGCPLPSGRHKSHSQLSNWLCSESAVARSEPTELC
uniref:Mitogen-activated protein kinase n=1 Tax=Noctiluca scintillans TaxID=2966 RepID=A0A7S0ZVX5_NOCSC